MATPFLRRVLEEPGYGWERDGATYKPTVSEIGREWRSRMNLFATKPLDLLLKEAHQSGDHCLKRTLGPFQLTALGVGAVIGAGIFVMAGLGAHEAGPALTLSFVMCGVACTFRAIAVNAAGIDSNGNGVGVRHRSFGSS